LNEKAKDAPNRYRIFFLIPMALLLGAIVLHDSLNADAETVMKNCLGCVNNTSTQVLTIFNFQTEDNPFLAGNSTFIIMPNPYAHTTNATDYLDLTTWFNFVVTDDGKFDSDPTPGIIELLGVNNGTYSIMQIKGSPGYGLANEPQSSDDVFGTTGFAYFTQTFVNYTSLSTAAVVEPPHISDEIFDKLKTVGGAKINGMSILTANDLPSAMLVNTGQKLTMSPPEHIAFTTSFAPGSTPSTLFNTLGIPTYSAPKGSAISDQSVFIPPVFVAPVSGGGNFLMSPIIDEINPGSNVLLRFDGVDQGTEHPLIEAIELPMSVQGTNVGISLRVDTSNPTGVAIPSGSVALFLDFEETGDIDFSDPTAYSSNPVIHFNVEKDGTACPDGVAVYLLDSGHWHEVTPGPTRNPSGDSAHTCAYNIGVEHFSSYLIGSGSAGHSHGSISHGSDHSSSHDSSHSEHSTSHSHVMGIGKHDDAYTQITRDLNIFEIEYDLQKAIARIIIGTTEHIDNIEVQIHSREGGIRTAHLIKNQQPEIIKVGDKTMKKYVFEVPLSPHETFFRVSVDDSRYNLNQSVKIEGITGKVIPWFASIHENGEHVGHGDIDMQGRSYITETGFDIKFNGGKKTVSYNGASFLIEYEMAGSISGIEVDEEARAVSLLLDSVSGGETLIKIPRSLIDAIDNNFVVMVTASPQTEIDYEIVASTPDYFTLKATLPENAVRLTIVGSHVIPEFGMISILILVVSIVGIVIILKTQKRILQYN
jgi:predicted secreted protein with PEFG-CTERM motif